MAAISNTALTSHRLRQFIDYDPETGIFTRRISTRGGRAGEIAGCINSLGYRVIRVDTTMYRAHRLAWLYVYGGWPEGGLDHKDGNPGNNAISNLRIANESQQRANAKRQTNTSGFKGVTWNSGRGRRWKSTIAKDGRGIHLGYFDTPEAAHAAYVAAAKKLFGEFARSD